MHISLEPSEQNTIQAYDDQQIQINSLVYTASLVVSKQELITDVNIGSINEVNQDYLSVFLKYQPEIILIGHPTTQVRFPIHLATQLSQQGIGVELMQIGAACRTYNVLMSENRRVVLGIIFPQGVLSKDL
jgi:uncharacterized protein